jgi:dethiobiotin synthetase/malonyl-CoA O-methyltransferase
MKGVFVTGTDTNVGKTIVSAWLVRSWHADYWKPIQSGTDEGLDADRVGALAPGAIIHPSTYLLKAPLSPHEAARLEGVEIELDAVRPPEVRGRLVIEGAGGVLAPLNTQDRIIDLIAKLGLPAIVVARSTLGTINHTALTVEALQRRDVPIAGIILNGPPNPANRQAITHFTGIRVVGELPCLDPVESLIRFPGLAWTPQSWEDA